MNKTVKSRTVANKKPAQKPTVKTVTLTASKKLSTKQQTAGTAARTVASKKVPQGRTLTTKDNYLKSKTKSTKKRPLVVVETNKKK